MTWAYHIERLDLGRGQGEKCHHFPDAGQPCNQQGATYRVVATGPEARVHETTLCCNHAAKLAHRVGHAWPIAAHPEQPSTLADWHRRFGHAHTETRHV
ncbi:MAG: hypothetical protein RLZZ127_1525 [Planctomycetota bacterium]|jgi:hypothetical protein